MGYLPYKIHLCICAPDNMSLLIFPAIGKTTEVKYLTCLGGITLNAHVEFLRNLSQRVSGLQEVRSVEQCDVILLFSPVVSRAEKDIKAALKKLTDLHGNAS